MKGGDDEDIPSDEPPPTPNEVVDVAAKNKSNDIRIGLITRARAKLLEQQVNSLLNEPGILIDENFILPKSLHICIDEDIPTLTPSPTTTEDVPAAINKIQSNEIRIGPITRARAKLLEQQVNSGPALTHGQLVVSPQKYRY